MKNLKTKSLLIFAFIFALNAIFISESVYAQRKRIKYDIIDQRGGKRAKQPKWLFKGTSQLENDYAGKIDIHLSELEENIDDMVDFGGVNYQESHSLDENHNTVFSIEGINETEYYFRNIIGNVVALRDGNIVCVDSFVVSDVAVGATFSTVAHFPADFSNGQLQAMKFDEVLIFSTYVDVT